MNDRKEEDGDEFRQNDDERIPSLDNTNLDMTFAAEKLQDAVANEPVYLYKIYERKYNFILIIYIYLKKNHTMTKNCIFNIS